MYIHRTLLGPKCITTSYAISLPYKSKLKKSPKFGRLRYSCTREPLLAIIYSITCSTSTGYLNLGIVGQELLSSTAVEYSAFLAPAARI